MPNCSGALHFCQLLLVHLHLLSFMMSQLQDIHTNILAATFFQLQHVPTAKPLAPARGIPQLD